MHSTKEKGIKIVPLHHPLARLILLRDARFANDEGIKLQLGYILMMAEKDDRCNILNYGSNKFKRISRKLMAASIQSLELGFEYSYLVKDLSE